MIESTKESPEIQFWNKICLLELYSREKETTMILVSPHEKEQKVF